MTETSSVKREGDHAVIRIPLVKVHDLRVSLEPCPCRAPKSNGGIEIRAALCAALARIEVTK